MSKNYFDFFEMNASFFIDEAQLKKQFYQNSKRFHPDFYAMESEEKQEEVLGLSTLNNKAYEILNNFDFRMRYVLELEGVIKEEGQNALPQMFLMEMMDVNEALMDLQMDFIEEDYKKIILEIEEIESRLWSGVEPDLLAFAESKSDCNLEKIKDYYFKKKYLLRIRENLDKFASA